MEMERTRRRSKYSESTHGEIYKFDSRVRILEVSNKRVIFSSRKVIIYLYI